MVDCEKNEKKINEKNKNGCDADALMHLLASDCILLRLIASDCN